jgi:triosephosphate isomerase (TIM)
MRKKIVAGNWKMNKNLEEGLSLVSEIIHMIADEKHNAAEVVMCVPFVHLVPVAKMIQGAENIHLAAQNCHQEESGAFTGEISADMIKSTGAGFVIIGHSERREYFGENDTLLAKKVNQVLSKGLSPIYCCGETLDIREAEKHIDVVKSQVTEALFGLSQEDIKRVVIAYEPVWAIGTGKTASAAQAQEMHHELRNHLAEKFGKEIAEEISILYGGSVKPDNAVEIFSEKDVDGGLIGGASLKSRDFMNIITAIK